MSQYNIKIPNYNIIPVNPYEPDKRNIFQSVMVYFIIYIVVFLNIFYPIYEMKITPNKNKAVNNRSPDLLIKLVA